MKELGVDDFMPSVDVGKLIGVEKIVGGSISKVGSTYSVSSRIVSVETGKILKGATYDYKGEIDEKYQGKGYGKIALTQVIDYVKSLKVFSNIKTSYVPAENGAEGFYKNFGFIDSDEIIKEFGLEDSDEIGMKYSLLQ